VVCMRSEATGRGIASDRPGDDRWLGERRCRERWGMSRLDRACAAPISATRRGIHRN
jgi:hypothetical protein